MVTAACAPSPMTTAPELPTAPRRPDGIVLDPDSVVPAAVLRAPGRGVVTLKEPVGDDVIRSAVDAFFDVFANRDADALDVLLSRSARLLDAHGGSSYGTLREELRGRIRAFDAAGVNSVRIDAIERYDYRDLGGDPGAPPRPAEMRPGDILVHVHVALPRSSGAKLFASVVALLLRWEEEAETPGKTVVRIAGYDEPDVR